MGSVIRTVLAIFAVVVLAACGDGGDGAAGDGATDGGGTSGETATVELVDFAIEAPDSVASGTEVTVTNTGDAPHTFTAQEGADFDTGTIEPGGEATVTITGSGSVDYVCTIHPDQMSGSLEVTG
ncbi:MAG: hypothetical protein R3343_09755 [Nitriliruptorales bacterium]|nr:hypothetical protein [Nitriliruptorales bacterium]